MLYEAPPSVPELSVQPPFEADPLLVSGTDAYCTGEYLYQDYLFDAHGADSTPMSSNHDEYGTFKPAGDAAYPTAERYAKNAADIVEIRIRPDSDQVVFRITLNTVLARDVPAVGIGIDHDRAGADAVEWPGGAGLSSPGLDSFITAWGTGGEVATRTGAATAFSAGEPLPAGAVDLDTTTNQLTIRVPSSMLPAMGAWRLVAGAGLWDGASGFLPVPAGSTPTATTPASGGLLPAPAIFNLGFRFTEGATGSNWFDAVQARDLARGTSGEAFADVDLTELDVDGCEALHAPTRDQARIFASRMTVPEGVHETFPNFGGRLQPYLVHLPPAAPTRPGLTVALHGNSATYTQWHAFSPRYLQQLGDDRNHVVLSPLGRSTVGTGVAFDWFEAWADLKTRVPIDPDRTTMSGYSAGGYNTFVTGTQFPDLFGGAFPIVAAARLLSGGLAGNQTNFNPMLGNMRWVPTVSWNQVVDELAPYIGIRQTHDELNRIGLRNRLFTFAAGEHFTPAILDQWTGAAEYLGDSQVTRNPHRIDYTIAPETWEMLYADLGRDTRFPEALMKYDHAYWVSDLRTRDDVRDATGTVRGTISAVSRAFGVRDAPTSSVIAAYPGPPQPATVDGTDWGPLVQAAPQNALEVTLTNLRTATIWGSPAKLSAELPLTVTVSTDGVSVVKVMLPIGPAARVEQVAGPAAQVELPDGAAVVRVAEGETVLVISPATDGPAAPGTPASPGGRLPATGGSSPAAAAALLTLAAVAARLYARRQGAPVASRGEA